jgi:ATP-dependent Clp protease ATP-binding subunit ClpA
MDIMNVLLQVMDNASLTDNSGNKADFQNVILVMTSNLGATQSSVMGFAKDDNLNESKAIKTFFAPEFRNRLDAIVNFNHLDINIVQKVVSKFIDDLNIQLKNKNITIKINTKVKKYLATQGYDKAMGARPLQRVISSKIKEPITNEILFGKLKNGGVVDIDLKDGELIFEYTAIK